jgi:chromosome segregation ATPase
MTSREARIERFIGQLDAFREILTRHEREHERVLRRIEGKLDETMTQVTDLRLEVRSVSPELVARHGEEIQELKRQWARVLGLAVGLAIGSGAIGGTAAASLLRGLLQ